MKPFKFLSLVLAVLLTLLWAQPVFAQDYYFEVPEAEIFVIVEEDGSLSIEYFYRFVNTAGAHPIDYVDIGMPGNSQYSLSDITASVDDIPISDISDSPYVDGVALGLGAHAIPAGGSGVVFMRAENVRNQFYFASTKEEQPYASFNFQPNFFGSEYVSGSTNLTVTFYLPPGMSFEDPRWINPKGWPGSDTPASEIDEYGRVIYQWSSTNAAPDGKYTFGATFPASYIPASVINTKQTFTFDPDALLGTILPIACCGSIFLIFGLVVYFSVKNAKKRQLKYLPPKIAIEGHGIKRGLTAVEAAILMEQPMDRILTMILFAVVKKEAAQVVKREPLEIKVEETLPQNLREYETGFLQAFRETSAAMRRKKLQDMMIALVKVVGEKMKGFSQKESVVYYKEIVNKAWQQVEQAETPEVRAEKYSEAVDWTMLDKDFDTRTQRTFGSGPVFMPSWWWRADPTISRTTGRTVGGAAARDSGSAAPSGGGKSTTISLPSLPGSNAAASVIGSVQAFSAGVVGNLTSFTGAVTSQTNPLPKPAPSTFRSSGGGGGGHSCACACACAGCACACAGGGR